MTEAYTHPIYLCLITYFFIFLIFIARSLVYELLEPRFKMAKGVVGNKKPLNTLLSSWLYKFRWRDSVINTKSIWIYVVAMQIFVITLYLNLVTYNFGFEVSALLIPTCILLSHIIMAIWFYFKRGYKYPAIQRITPSAITSAFVVSLSIYGLNETSNSISQILYPFKWGLLFFLYIMSVPLMTTGSKRQEMPLIISQMSEIIWATGLVCLFLKPFNSIIWLVCLEQFFKTIFILSVYDSVKVFMSKERQTFFVEHAIRNVFPVALLALFFILLGT